IDSSSRTSASLRPMKRLMEKTVLVGLVTAWRLATVPTRRSPDWVKATTDGVVRPPSAFSMRSARRPRGRPYTSWSCRDRYRWSWPYWGAPQLRVLNKISVKFAEILAQLGAPVRAHTQKRAVAALWPLRVTR